MSVSVSVGDCASCDNRTRYCVPGVSVLIPGISVVGSMARSEHGSNYRDRYDLGNGVVMAAFT